MTDNLSEVRPGTNGAHFLEQQAAAFKQPQGPYPNAPVQTVAPEPEGFDAGDVWTFPYNLNPYVKAEGHIPPPSQAKIDGFQRAMAKLYMDYEKAVKEAEKAQEGAEDESTSLTMEDVERAFTERDEAVGKIKDAVAALCSGHPTRKQLDGLPEYVFMRFVGVLGRKLNPEA